MDTVDVGPVTLCYEWLGDQGAPVVLLVNGLGGQLTDWDDGFCALLLAEGFSVVRFDNRDAGLSTSFDDAPAFDYGRGVARDPAAAGYLLDDMADDAAGLLGALGIARAHVVGVSMGGMIAQMLAVRHPSRVASLCSIMSTTGAGDVGRPDDAALQVLLRPPPRDRAGYIERQLENRQVLGSPGFPVDDERVRARAGAAYDRSFRPAGVGRQLMAILVSGDRTARLASITAPTLVLHGDADRLVAPSGGVATRDAIPGAQLVEIEGMGHELPPGTWPRVVALVTQHARAADAAAAARS